MERQRPLRLVLWGLGAMGREMAAIILQRPGLAIAGAIDRNPARAGRDLGEVLGLGGEMGIHVSPQPEGVLDTVDADMALIATGSLLDYVYPQVRAALEAGLDVITIAEEMAYPWAAGRERAEELDRLARARGKRVLGTGINPGFVLDTLIIAMTGVCRKVERIRARRVNDLSPFGPTVMASQGVGTTPEGFRRGVEEGRIVGHVGFPQSMHLIARAVGWELESVREEREPIISATYREAPHARIAPGQVAGCRHTARGFVAGREAIVMEHPQQVEPAAEGVETGDYIIIEGEPGLSLAIQPEIPGGKGTAAIAVNMIPLVRQAPPGLLTMADLPVPRAALGELMTQ